MKKIKTLSTLGFAALLGVCGAVSSCNKDSDSAVYETTSNLAVTNFRITSDLGDQELDTTFFTIDLNRKMIFNADSLKKGTDISKLVASISFSSVLSEAKIIMSGGTTREGEIDYQENPTDSIDFTGKVQLQIKADDGAIGMTYDIKVNVHKLDPDSLCWDSTARNTLPSKATNPVRQKTVQMDETAYSVIQENDGSYTFRSSDDVEGWKWTDINVAFNFTPDIMSLASSSDKLWILDTYGNLYRLIPGESAWVATGEKWESIIGGYTDTVIGLEKNGNATVFTQYPAANINKSAIPAQFPVEGRSNFVTLTNKWTSSPVAFFCGGVTAAGSYSSATWAFDGREWIQLSEGGIPALEGASLIQYYNYRKSAAGTVMDEYKVWMLLGGRTSDGTFNRTVYVSYDNGVNWTTGSASLQLPDEIPAMVNCDGIVIDSELSSNLSDLWKKQNRPAKIKYELDGDIISWECPYIYLFGGYAPDGTLYNTVWRGVLTRLTFTPII